MVSPLTQAYTLTIQGNSMKSTINTLSGSTKTSHLVCSFITQLFSYCVCLISIHCQIFHYNNIDIKDKSSFTIHFSPIIL